MCALVTGVQTCALPILALLCGLGGGNFASSVANISFFFTKSEKGSALALNSGLGNVGVSLMQFLVPLVVTMSLFGALGGQDQTLDDGTSSDAGPVGKACVSKGRFRVGPYY